MIRLLQPLLVLPPSLTSRLFSFAAPPHKLTHPKPSTIIPKDQLELLPVEKSHFTVHEQPAPQQQAHPQNWGEKLGRRQQLIITGPAGAGSGRAVRAVARSRPRSLPDCRPAANTPGGGEHWCHHPPLNSTPGYASCICLYLYLFVFVKFYSEV